MFNPQARNHKSPRFDVTTIGEGNLRFSVPAGEQLELAHSMNLAVAGSEGNVAGALAHLGWNTGWVSRMPPSILSKRVLNDYRLAGVDTSAVVSAPGERLATLFVDYAAPPRPTQVIFDRKDSAFTRMTLEEVNWDYLLDTRMIHLTGITVALSENLREILTGLVRRAKTLGIALSFDINYRERLWTLEDARRTLLPFIEKSDLLLCSHDDACNVLECQGTPKDALLQLVKKAGAEHVVMSVGDKGVLAWDGERILEVPAKPVTIIDRIGAGDALAAGVLHGVLQGGFAGGLEHGCTMAALAMSQFGEMVLTTNEDLKALNTQALKDIVR